MHDEHRLTDDDRSWLAGIRMRAEALTEVLDAREFARMLAGSDEPELDGNASATGVLATAKATRRRVAGSTHRRRTRREDRRRSAVVARTAPAARVRGTSVVGDHAGGDPQLRAVEARRA
jgi:hypothetical protein